MSPQQDQPLDPKKLLRAAMAGSSDAEPAPNSWQPPSVEDLATLFPELEVVELVGRGGMGAVYRAVQKRLGRTVALKVLPPELAADPAFEERFLREARTLAGLQHPRILTVHDFGDREGFFFLVTEFVEGMNLRQLMDMGELSPTEALRITPQICEALQYAHDHGVVHRDIKPENLLVDSTGDVKIADFGLARILGEAPGAALTRSTQILGTPHYMAPEQWRHGIPVDHRADIYSVGVVLYEMLTGQLPLGHFEPPSRRRGVPPGLDAVVQRSLAQQPEQRYQRASDVGQDLERQRTGAARACRHRARREASHAGTPGIPGVLKVSWPVAVLVVIGSFAFALWASATHGQRHLEELARESAVVSARAWAAEESIEWRALDEDELLARHLDQKLMPEWESRRRAAEQRGVELSEAAPSVPPAPSTREPSRALWPTFGGIYFLTALLFTFSGFSAISRIRVRADGTTGLGLAIFTAWIAPIALVIAIPTSVLNLNISDSDVALVTSTIVAVVLGVAGIAWMVVQHRRIAAELS